MRHSHDRDLHDELLAAGATKDEAEQLGVIADHISRLGHTTKRRKNYRSSIVSVLIGAAVACVVLITATQQVLPSSVLYPIENASDTALVILHPDYRGKRMMKQANQIEQLVRQHAPSNIVLASLTAYENDESAYQKTATNYATLGHCKDSLQAAATIAPTNERQAITRVVDSIDNA